MLIIEQLAFLFCCPFSGTPNGLGTVPAIHVTGGNKNGIGIGREWNGNRKGMGWE